MRPLPMPPDSTEVQARTVGIEAAARIIGDYLNRAAPPEPIDVYQVALETIDMADTFATYILRGDQ